MYKYTYALIHQVRGAISYTAMDKGLHQWAQPRLSSKRATTLWLL